LKDAEEDFLYQKILLERQLAKKAEEIKKVESELYKLDQ
jgi:hypothetical protein